MPRCVSYQLRARKAVVFGETIGLGQQLLLDRDINAIGTFTDSRTTRLCGFAVQQPVSSA